MHFSGTAEATIFK